ncbi:LOW QUALITY PROTEIN: hypothetical protein PHMEG_00021022 [Phytophthora megakarya]|uniref:Uncharacterized protein n=1 Tax=Phytophthora megakarya TaxID=4795 RepID=A0A225VNM0_9STRA|nr:LOW QUALITY PROTEIN: hypothetical protein PHMEG_00021022 [Phytophthora megakarya]
MSPTQASSADDRDFPRLNGRNFIIWKTRVTAALEGKSLLGFVTHADYAGDDDPDFSDEEEDLDPALFEENQDVRKTLDDIGAPSADHRQTPPESSEASSTASDADGDVEMAQVNLPVVQSFTTPKQNERKRAGKQKTKRTKLSSRSLRIMEAKAKAFLIKTIDDQHILMVKDKTTAFEIFQTICNKYEGAAAHGDPYYIQSYLMTLKYEEGTDLTAFFFEVEQDMKATAEATDSVMSDQQKSLYLYHALPTAWKSEMTVWKGTRKYIPYEDLKRNIEMKVHHELAHNRYALKQGTPESKETRSEKAMQATIPEPTPLHLPLRRTWH